MTLAQFWSVAASVLGVIGLTGAAIGFLFATSVKAQMQALRDDRDDLLKRDERKTTEIAALQAKVEAQADQIAALQAVVTGKEQLEALLAGQREILDWLGEHARKVDEYHRALRVLARSAHRDEVRMLWDVLALLGDHRHRPSAADADLTGDDDVDA